MNKADSLNCIRHIAESFIAKHAPDEIRYFPIIWNRFCGENLLSQRSSRVSILTFAEQNNIGLISPSVLFILKGVMFELKTKIDKPSLEKVRNAVRACAVELGAPKDIAISLEQDLSVMVYENLLNLLGSVDNICNAKFPQQRSVCINSIRDIRIDDQKTEFEARQPLILFCELIRKNRLHWSIAFLLFPKWCNIAVKEPKEQFKKLGYKMNMFMQDNGLGVKIDWEKSDSGKAEYVRLIVPENIRISGNIIESKELIEAAEGMIKEGRYKDALDIAIKAFNKDSGWLKPMTLFAEAVACLGSERLHEFDNNPTYIRHKLYYNQELRVRAAPVIESYGLVSRQDASLHQVVLCCKDEIKQISRALHILDEVCESGMIKLTPQDFEYEFICETLRKMKNAGDDQYNVLLHRLCLNESVKEIIEKVAKVCKYKFNLSNGDVLSYFKSFIHEQANSLIQFENINHIKGNWIKSLNGIIKEGIKKTTHRLDDDASGRENNSYSLDDDPEI